MGLDHIVRVLFLCTGNSARSIIAECLLNHFGKAQFRAFSAGSHPAGVVNPLALEVLNRRGVSVAGVRSKSWDEFAGEAAGPMDIVVTVCDNAAGEVCPVWPGAPVALHWGIPDPAAVTGSPEDKRVAFLNACLTLEIRILDLLALAAKTPDKESFLAELKASA